MKRYIILPIIFLSACVTEGPTAKGPEPLLPQSEEKADEYLCKVEEETFEPITDEQIDDVLGLQDEKRFNRGKEFSFQFLGQNIKETLMELSTQANVPIVVDENVEGSVSVEIKNEFFLDSLKMILASGPFDYRFTGKFFYVGTADVKEKSWARLSHTYRYKLQHIKPSTAEKLLGPSFKDMIKAEDALGILTVHAPKSFMKMIIQSISDIDKPQRQVLLKLTISEVVRESGSLLGRNEGAAGTAYDAVNSLAPIRPAFDSAVLSKDAYREFLQSILMLHREGLAELKAQPKIIVQDGEKAEFRSQSKKIIGNLTGHINKSSFVETGVGLSLIPSIVDNDEISLQVMDASSGEFDDNPSTVREHSVKTKVRVKPGETILLGGMISNKTSKSVRKVPYLGDIPYLGWLFKSESEQEIEVEVVFTISPEILCRR